jgi:hypothetical protein
MGIVRAVLDDELGAMLNCSTILRLDHSHFILVKLAPASEAESKAFVVFSLDIFFFLAEIPRMERGPAIMFTTWLVVFDPIALWAVHLRSVTGWMQRCSYPSRNAERALKVLGCIAP